MSLTFPQQNLIRKLLCSWMPLFISLSLGPAFAGSALCPALFPVETHSAVLNDLALKVIGNGQLYASVDPRSRSFQDLTVVVLRLYALEEDEESRVLKLSDRLQIPLPEAKLLLKYIAEQDLKASQNPPAFYTDTPLSQKQSDILNNYVLPAIGNRHRYLRVTPSDRNDKLVIQSPTGEFTLFVEGDAAVVESQTAEARIVDRHGPWLEARITIGERSKNAMGRVRQVFQADPYLSAALTPPSLIGFNLPSEAAPHCKSAVEHMMQMDREQRNNSPSSPVVLGQMLPRALGEKVIISEYARELYAQRVWTRQPRVIVVAEDLQSLAQAARDYKKELQIPDAAIVQSVFGRTNRKQALDPSAELILVTHTTLGQRMLDFAALGEDEGADRRPFLYVFLGAYRMHGLRSQMRHVFSELKRTLSPKDRIVLSSLLFSQEIITNLLGGYVHGPLLEGNEIKDLREGQNTLDLARLQLLRTFLLGYGSPIEPVNEVVSEGEVQNRDLFKRFRRSQGTGQIVIHAPFYDELWARMHALQIPGIPNRAIIFEADVTRAAESATRLNQKSAEMRQAEGADHGSKVQLRDLTYRRTYYENAESLRWLQHRNYENRDFRALTTVDMMRADLDGAANMLVITRNVSELRTLLTILNRAIEPSPFVPHTVVLDYSGLLRKFLGQKIYDLIRVDPLKVRPRFTPVIRQTVVDTESVRPEEFRSNTLPAFEQAAWLMAQSSELNPISDRDLADFKSKTGGIQGLLRDYPSLFVDGVPQNQSLFTELLTHLPEELKRIARERLMRILDTPEDPFKQLMQGLMVFSHAFNSQSLIQRYGLLPIRTAQIADIYEVERLLCGMIPYRLPIHLRDVSLTKALRIRPSWWGDEEIQQGFNSGEENERSRAFFENPAQIPGPLRPVDIDRLLGQYKAAKNQPGVNWSYWDLYVLQFARNQKVRDPELLPQMQRVTTLDYLNGFFGITPKTALQQTQLEQWAHPDLMEAALDQEILVDQNDSKPGEDAEVAEFLSEKGSYQILRFDYPNAFVTDADLNPDLFFNSLIQYVPERLRDVVQRELELVAAQHKAHKQTLEGLKVFARAFNQMTLPERGGLTEVEPDTVCYWSPMERLLSGLIPYRLPAVWRNKPLRERVLSVSKMSFGPYFQASLDARNDARLIRGYLNHPEALLQGIPSSVLDSFKSSSEDDLEFGARKLLYLYYSFHNRSLKAESDLFVDVSRLIEARSGATSQFLRWDDDTRWKRTVESLVPLIHIRVEKKRVQTAEEDEAQNASSFSELVMKLVDAASVQLVPRYSMAELRDFTRASTDAAAIEAMNKIDNKTTDLAADMGGSGPDRIIDRLARLHRFQLYRLSHTAQMKRPSVARTAEILWLAKEFNSLSVIERRGFAKIDLNRLHDPMEVEHLFAALQRFFIPRHLLEEEFSVSAGLTERVRSVAKLIEDFPVTRGQTKVQALDFALKNRLGWFYSEFVDLNDTADARSFNAVANQPSTQVSLSRAPFYAKKATLYYLYLYWLNETLYRIKDRSPDIKPVDINQIFGISPDRYDPSEYGSVKELADYINAKTLKRLPLKGVKELPRLSADKKEKARFDPQAFAGPEGGMHGLRFDYPQFFTPDRIDAIGLLDHLAGYVPERLQAELRVDLEGVTKAADTASPEQLLLKGLRRLGATFNKMTLHERGGLNEVDVAKITEMQEVERLLCGIVPYRIPVFWRDPELIAKPRNGKNPEIEQRFIEFFGLPSRGSVDYLDYFAYPNLLLKGLPEETIKWWQAQYQQNQTMTVQMGLEWFGYLFAAHHNRQIAPISHLFLDLNAIFDAPTSSSERYVNPATVEDLIGQLVNEALKLQLKTNNRVSEARIERFKSGGARVFKQLHSTVEKLRSPADALEPLQSGELMMGLEYVYLRLPFKNPLLFNKMSLYRIQMNFYQNAHAPEEDEERYWKFPEELLRHLEFLATDFNSLPFEQRRGFAKINVDRLEEPEELEHLFAALIPYYVPGLFRNGGASVEKRLKASSALGDFPIARGQTRAQALESALTNPDSWLLSQLGADPKAHVFPYLPRTYGTLTAAQVAESSTPFYAKKAILYYLYASWLNEMYFGLKDRNPAIKPVDMNRLLGISPDRYDTSDFGSIKRLAYYIYQQTGKRMPLNEVEELK